MKMIRDTMMINGRWSQKRIMIFSSFWIATLYAFTPILVPNFEVHEFVFLGFIGGGAYAVFRAQKRDETGINNNETIG